MPIRPLAAAVAILLSGAAQAAPSFVNGLALDGAMLDLSGGSDVNNGRVGFFSDIYYDSQRNEWWGLSDRGPGGGTLDYATRMQRFTLDVDASSGAIGNFKIVETVIFKSAGAPLNGIAPSPASNIGLAFDPEGLVINPKTGTFLVSDEYGPSVREFSRSGELIRSFTTPANLVPRDAAGNANFASDAGNTAGKRTNRGFEGLAISPDGKFAFAMLQSAMLDEGGGNGTMNRIVKFDTATGQAVGQYAYAMKRSGQGQGISALVAINDHEFYVLERNNRGIGVGATLATADKEVYRIDLSGATDVSTDSTGRVGPTPAEETASTKTPQADSVTPKGSNANRLASALIGIALPGAGYTPTTSGTGESRSIVTSRVLRESGPSRPAVRPAPRRRSTAPAAATADTPAPPGPRTSWIGVRSISLRPAS